jgi:hypothetical protein
MNPAAILPSSLGFDPTGESAFIRLHSIPAVVTLWRGKSAGQEGELW